MKRYLLIVVVACVNIICVYAQDDNSYFRTGCLPELEPEKLPRQAELMSRDFENLPSSCLLTQFCPIPQSQGNYGTCTSWASAYAFRTILEAIKCGWTSKEKITDEAFSPPFIYTQIKINDDANCQKGSCISDAFIKMKYVGAVKKNIFDVDCINSVPADVMSTAAPYKLGSYTALFYSTMYMTEAMKLKSVKKALVSKQPVVIGMRVYPSFNKCRDVWDGNTFGTFGNHAMCVVGYDDNKYGGAFLIMNSWGINWGNGGFTWVRYFDFCRTVGDAFTGSLPFSPSPVVNKNILSGSIELKLSTGATMLPVLADEGNGSKIYNIRGSYMSGTRYRLYLTNKEPAFVYIIGYDTNGNTSLVFPPRDNISPALTYKNSHIAIPDEKWYIEMDNNTGTDYLCVLYSKSEIDINKVLSAVRTGSGSITNRINSALGSAIASPSEVYYNRDNISFEAKTSATIVPIITSIKHI